MMFWSRNLRKFDRLPLATRLLFWFLAISLIPLGIAIYLIYSLSEKSLIGELEAHLAAIADSKCRLLDDYSAERKLDVTTLAVAPNVSQAIEELSARVAGGDANPAEYRSAVEKYEPVFREYLERSNYVDLLLTSSNEVVLFSVRDPSISGSKLQGSHQDSELYETVDHAKTLLETEISNFQFDPQLEIPTAFVAAPVFKNDVAIGVVVLKMKMDGIRRIVLDYRGLGKTGETVIGSRTGDTVLFQTALRFDRAAAFRRRIRMGSEEFIPLQNAVRGQRGSGISAGYTGGDVLAVWRYLPSFRWGLVVRQNTDEAFAPIYRQRNIVLIFGGIVTIFVIMVALLVASSLTKPIRNLTRVAIRISDGDLSGGITTARNGSSRSEVDILYRGFSKMKSGLLNLVAGMQRSTVDVRSSSTQISAATRQLETAVTQQAASTNEVVATAKEIFATSKELAASMADLNTVAGETASNAESGRAGLAEMEAVIDGLVKAEETIAARLETVRERASNISTIITTIGKIADRTNLLSLNAAIEAEKAGESGSGFAVVATEIRRLSDQTGNATLEIEEMIREMQTAVLSGVSGMENYSRQLHDGVGTIQQLSHQFGRIMEMIQDLTPRFETASDAMQAQSVGAEQISESMVYLGEAAQQTAESVRDLNRITNQLNHAAQTLRDEVSRFKVDEPNDPPDAGPLSQRH
jgi:methyl-accepting chemotaxis protein WspA